MTELAKQLLELTYIVIGCQFLHTAYCSYKDKTNPVRLGTSAFWTLLSITFIGGSYMPNMSIGIIVILLSLLTLFKQVRIGTLPSLDEMKANIESNRLKNKIFIPVMLMAILALVLAQMIPEFSKISISLAALFATISVLVITNSHPKSLLSENNRMTQQVSTSGIVPSDSRFIGVLAYVLGMVLFTMIMGNAFAAFTVITAGVGVPFVFALGANPIVAGALAMTAGYCGTLLTPMAANFNALPAALMDMKDQNGVIKAQAGVALVMIVIHIFLMYFLAF
ncbi:TPA: SP_0859 family membrane protein [Streptococcus pneumoniae]|uniref:DUF979 domain-containing protein n=1 Tax=Streptococcus pneumoniae TaxID=1313 RepID=UPI0005DBEAF2|nr:DUF979 family protein [Streptococcus pneumoniae]MDS2731155.1 DUF979 family protein [Streptococcus pneumoniae]MDS5544578.1 DUF979 family protein [Streptococcus pneumoniae]MDS5558706.1 DUF979 family protein [Streptococcus pneumoniae]MDS8580692.1 DUF979 family protein [Streptococcus pneumoniae]TVW49600.1 DUF979 family protein [Streptococcus pneumoniae]